MKHYGLGLVFIFVSVCFFFARSFKVEHKGKTLKL